jgi:hypothetical protein
MQATWHRVWKYMMNGYNKTMSILAWFLLGPTCDFYTVNCTASKLQCIMHEKRQQHLLNCKAYCKMDGYAHTDMWFRYGWFGVNSKSQLAYHILFAFSVWFRSMHFVSIPQTKISDFGSDIKHSICVNTFWCFSPKQNDI